MTEDEWDLQFADVYDQINAYVAGSPMNVVKPAVLNHVRLSPSSGRHARASLLQDWHFAHTGPTLSSGRLRSCRAGRSIQGWRRAG